MAVGASRRPDFMSPPPRNYKKDRLEKSVFNAIGAPTPFREWTREDAGLFLTGTVIPLQETQKSEPALEMNFLKVDLVLKKYLSFATGFKEDIKMPVQAYHRVKSKHGRALATLTAALMTFVAFLTSVGRLIATIGGAVPALLLAVFVFLPMKIYFACIDAKNRRLLRELTSATPPNFPQKCKERIEAIFQELEPQKNSKDYYKKVRVAALKIARALPQEQQGKIFMQALHRAVAAYFLACPSQEEWARISSAGFEREALFNDLEPQLKAELQDNNVLYHRLLHKEKELLVEKERLEASLYKLHHEPPYVNRKAQEWFVELQAQKLQRVNVEIHKIQMAKEELEKQFEEGNREWLNMRQAASSVEPTSTSASVREEYEELPLRQDRNETEGFLAVFFSSPSAEAFAKLEEETASCERGVFYSLLLQKLPGAIETFERRREELQALLSQTFARLASLDASVEGSAFETAGLELRSRQEFQAIQEINATLEYLEELRRETEGPA